MSSALVSRLSPAAALVHSAALEGYRRCCRTRLLPLSDSSAPETLSYMVNKARYAHIFTARAPLISQSCAASWPPDELLSGLLVTRVVLPASWDPPGREGI